MNWFCRLFGAHIVALFEPYSDGEDWLYVFGDETKFEIRKFKTAEDAQQLHLNFDGVAVRAPEVPIKLINLTVEQTRAVTGAGNYREIIETHA